MPIVFSQGISIESAGIPYLEEVGLRAEIILIGSYVTRINNDVLFIIDIMLFEVVFYFL